MYLYIANFFRLTYNNIKNNSFVSKCLQEIRMKSVLCAIPLQ